ncbi:MAG: thiol peroxidase, partial [Gaiellales bacterium]
MAADSRAVERAGGAHELGRQLTVLGAQLAVGDLAPPFVLDGLPGANDETRELGLASTAGHVRLLHVELYTISMDLPYAQARFNRAENVQHRSLSAHRSEEFGRDYGVLIREWRLLQRS